MATTFYPDGYSLRRSLDRRLQIHLGRNLLFEGKGLYKTISSLVRLVYLFLIGCPLSGFDLCPSVVALYLCFEHIFDGIFIIIYHCVFGSWHRVGGG